MKTKNEIILLGVPLNTGNLGVNALAVSCIQLIHQRWPDSEIVLFGGREDAVYDIGVSDSIVSVRCVPLRFCSNLLMPNHFLWLLLVVIIIRLFPAARRRYARSKRTAGVLARARFFMDITAGDSFSDIYGMKRLFYLCCTKRLCQLTGGTFVMLPQTYGPFKSQVARYWARHILKRAEQIYSRDKDGVKVVRSLLSSDKEVRLCPDVAFTLGARPGESGQIASIEEHKKSGKVLVGLNISGLLFNEGYTGQNEFQLKVVYPDFVRTLIHRILDWEDTVLLLVPHVLPLTPGVEDDLAVCEMLYKCLPTEAQDRCLVIREPLSRRGDPTAVKWIIGQCDFFLGSRMHATIAAISQCVPTVGLAYSKKFLGVYETVNLTDFAIDLCQTSEAEVLEMVDIAYAKRDEIRHDLQNAIPCVKRKISEMFEKLERC